MTKNDFAKLQRYSGVMGVLVLWVGITIGMHKAHLGIIDSRPLSYLGVDARTSVLFSTSLLVSSILFVSFAFYAKRHFNIRGRFLGYFIIGQIGQVIAAVTPYGSNSRLKTIHTVAAFALAFSLPFLIRQFTITQSKSPHHKLYVNLLRLEQLAFLLGIGLFVFTHGIAPLGEALPAIGFHIWIIAVTFTSNN